MTKDRMPDLQMANRHAGGSVRSSTQNRKSNELNDFLEEISDLRHRIETIEIKTKELQELHEQLLTTVSPTTELQKNIDQIMVKVQQEILEVRRTIKGLEEVHGLNETKIKTQARIKCVQLAAIQTQFLKVTENHANVLLAFRERFSARLRRQLKLVNRNSTDPETIDLLESGEMALFVDNYMLDYRSARLELEEAEERCNQLFQVEKQLYELRDMFVDMAILVEHQGTLIDQIRFYSENTEVQIGRARDSLWKTLKKQASLRKKKIIIILIVVLVIFIIILCLILG